MCGIAGILNLDGNPIDIARLEKLRQGIKQRGPDGETVKVYNHFGVVTSRLAMVDPNGSWQPIASRDDRWILVGNGEIYNYKSLRAEIDNSEYQFTTNGDLEVLIPLIARFGPDGLARLRGPFAVAIWDSWNRELWLARDRWGERPLYITCDGNKLLFSSTIYSIVSSMDTTSTVDRRAVALFIGTGIVSAGKTLFGSVQAVMPGTAVKFGDFGVKSPRSYRHYTQKISNYDRLSHSNAIANFPSVLERAVDRCLRVQMPITLAFSGGLDSTAILVSAREKTNLRVLTLVAEDTHQIDENRLRARQITWHLGVSHEEVPWAIPTPESCYELLATRLGEPAPDPIVLHNDALSREVASSGRVVLGGHGADEVLAGYDRYRALITHFPHAEAPRHQGPTNLGQMPFAPQFAEWYRMRVIMRWLELVPQFLVDRSADATGLPEVIAEFARVSSHLNSDDLLDLMQLTDFLLLDAHENFTLPDESGMIYGVEQRCPYLDHDLVEFAFACPRELRVDGGAGKILLRRYLNGFLPSELLNRPKVGFEHAFDYDAWLHANRNVLLRCILDGPLPKLKVFTPHFWNWLSQDSNFSDEHAGIMWRAFSLSAWLGTHAS